MRPEGLGWSQAFFCNPEARDPYSDDKLTSIVFGIQERAGTVHKQIADLVDCLESIVLIWIPHFVRDSEKARNVRNYFTVASLAAAICPARLAGFSCWICL